jgi:cell division septation protein DedD
MDPALKQRVVGAVVLVSLAVIFVPMVLHEPDLGLPAYSGQAGVPLPAAAEIVPLPEATTKEIPLSHPEVATRAAPAPASSGGDEVPPEVVEFLKGSEAVQPGGGASAAEVTAAALAGAPAKHGVAGKEKAGDKDKDKDKDKAGARKGEHSGAGEGGKKDTPAEKGAKGAKGKETAAAAAAAAATEKGGARSGATDKAHPDKAHLDKARQDKVAMDGGKPGKDEHPPHDPVKDKPGAFVVQLGSFADEANARKLADRLHGAGFKAFVDHPPGAGTRYRVRIGPHLSEHEAEQVEQRLKRDLSISGRVLHYP